MCKALTICLCQSFRTEFIFIRKQKCMSQNVITSILTDNKASGKPNLPIDPKRLYQTSSFKESIWKYVPETVRDYQSVPHVNALYFIILSYSSVTEEKELARKFENSLAKDRIQPVTWTYSQNEKVKLHLQPKSTTSAWSVLADNTIGKIWGPYIK